MTKDCSMDKTWLKDCSTDETQLKDCSTDETWFKDCGTHQTWLKVYLLNDKEARAIKLILETMFIETNTKKHDNLYTCGFSLVKLQVTFCTDLVFIC